MELELALAMMPEEFQERAWTMWSREGDCWRSMYSAPAENNPVPRFYWVVGGEQHRIQHRVVTYFLAHRILPSRLIASCGNDRCVDPSHMLPVVCPPLHPRQALTEHPVPARSRE